MNLTEARDKQVIEGEVLPPETAEESRQTTGIWMYVGIAFIMGSILVALFTF